MNILDKIIDYKRKEVAERKQLVSESLLRENDLFKRPVFSLKEFLLEEGKTGIIAEFKRRSPSKGVINDQVDVAEITAGYTRFGDSGLSVLTDEAFFGGSKEDLVKARENLIPILRKDFIIDEYQIVEARAMGADVILLIATCLSPEEVKNLAVFARKLDLEVLLELHGEEELDHICDETELIGINNRDLKTFAVDIERSLLMAEKIPGNKIKIAESGISTIENVRLFQQHGFRGFLIGENFMKEADPVAAFEKFANGMKVHTH